MTDRSASERVQELAPYGELVSESGATTLLNGFTDKYLDSEDGLNYFGARYYLPGVGRWGSADPLFVEERRIDLTAGGETALKDQQRLRLWLYTSNNPVTKYDPTGTREASYGSAGEPGVSPSLPDVPLQTPAIDPIDIAAAILSGGGSTAEKEIVQAGKGVVEEVSAKIGGKAAGEELATASAKSISNQAGSELAEMSGILRDAAKGKGNFGLGTATREQADAMGKAWVGEGYKVASDGKTLVSSDGLRTYRPPSYKPNLEKIQANFESKAKVPGLATLQTYTYDPSRLQILTGVGTDTYQFDIFGNLARRNADAFTFDAQNHLASFLGATKSENYFYDENGERVEKRNSKENVLFASKYFEQRGPNAYRYIFAGSKRIAMIRGGVSNIYYIHDDHLGSSNDVTDPTGAVTDHKEFAPYGELVSEMGQTTLMNGFVAKYQDAETGLYSFEPGRYYLSGTGRWASPDPRFEKERVTPGRDLDARNHSLNDIQRIALTVYCQNNPLNRLDLEGKWSAEAHAYLINAAFPQLSAKARENMRGGSEKVDTDQSKGGAFMHAMSSPKMDVQVAREKMVNFIIEKYGEARAALAEGDTFRAEVATGEALHAVMDYTSPAHEGFQQWNGMLSLHSHEHGDVAALGKLYGSKETLEDLVANPAALKKSVNLMKAVDAKLSDPAAAGKTEEIRTELVKMFTEPSQGGN